MQPDDIVIVAAKRTPIGTFQGALAPLSATELGACAHIGAMHAAGISPELIDEVISGCVLSAGLGQAPARQASIAANIPNTTGATTINKVCGSGMKAVMLAHDAIKAGSAQTVLASGMESMSNAPYLLSKARTGYRLGDGILKDHIYIDGLEDAYAPGTAMGVFAEAAVKLFQFDREFLDEYAIESMTRALHAQETSAFLDEIVPVHVKNELIKHDQAPDLAKIKKIPALKPVFQVDGTITAANASSLADGAASLILTTYAHAKTHDLKPLARIVAHATHAQEPQWFTLSPATAIRKVMARAKWSLEQVDLFEINEAFAVVTLIAIEELGLDPKKVNVHGGACALGHPIGASGARIIVTLLHALQHHHKKRGIAALCIGGGEATAMAIEII